MIDILIVDDEPDLELLIKQKFRREIRNNQYFFHFAHNGVEALKILSNKKQITVIVTDINMPEMDGLELLRKVNEMNIPTLKTVIVSAYSDMNNIRTAMNNGAFDFLTKPLDLLDLALTIEKTIKLIEIIRKGVDLQEKLSDYNQELEVARKIQQAILPKTFPPYPTIKNFDIFGKMEAAKQVGGDFFDFFMIDSSRIGFVIGDVSGKGVPSSIFMAVSRTLIYSFGMSGHTTDECLRLTNEILVTESVDSMFVTVFYGILNTDSGEVKYTNAGHNYPYIARKNGEIDVLNQGSSIILGAFENSQFTSNSIKLEPNEVLFLYTDGVNEAMDSQNNQLGENELITCLYSATKSTKSPKYLVNKVFNLVKEHSKDCPQSDDVTALAITYYGDK